MVKQKIWPHDGHAPVVEVDAGTHRLIAEIASQQPKPDEFWEHARKIILSEQKAELKRKRHASGDFGAELVHIEQLRNDIAERTDGKPYQVTQQISEKIWDMKTHGFAVSEVDALVGMHTDLLDELYKTGALARELRDAIEELRGEDE